MLPHLAKEDGLRLILREVAENVQAVRGYFRERPSTAMNSESEISLRMRKDRVISLDNPESMLLGYS
jgi:hypothetical protein